MVIFHKFFKIIFENNVISADNLKMCGISPKWGISAKYFQNHVISADNLKFCWKSSFLTNSQRKWAYFRFKIFKIVCHDLPIRSIFQISFKNQNSTDLESKSRDSRPRGENADYVLSNLSYFTQILFGISRAHWFTTINYGIINSTAIIRGRKKIGFGGPKALRILPGRGDPVLIGTLRFEIHSSLRAIFSAMRAYRSKWL